MAYLPPFHPCLTAGPRVFGPGCLTYGSPYINRLSGPSTPPQRLSLPLAALNPVPGRPGARTKAPRLSFLALQHFRIGSPFFSPLTRRPEGVALLSWKSHPQGLATLSMVPAKANP
jgi:hypothetical protein